MRFELHLTWTSLCDSSDRSLIVSHSVFQRHDGKYCLCLFGSMPPLNNGYKGLNWREFKSGSGQQVFGKLIVSALSQAKDGSPQEVLGTEANTLKLVAERKCVQGYQFAAKDNPTWLQGMLDIEGGQHVPTSIVKRTSPRLSGPRCALGPWWDRVAITAYEHRDPGDPAGRAIPADRIPVILESLSETARRQIPRRRRIKFKDRLETLTPEDHAKAMALLAELCDIGLNVLSDMKEGCTEVVLDLSPEDAAKLDSAFEKGHLSSLGVVFVGPESEATCIIHPNPLEILHTGDDSLPLIERFVRHASFIEGIRRPWRRFFALLSLDVTRSRMAAVVRESGDRFYGQRLRLIDLRSLRIDLTVGAVWWPLLTTVLILISCASLHLFGFQIDAFLGIGAGLAMSLIGSVPCSYVLSPLACTCGAVFIGWAFGTATSLVLARSLNSDLLARATILADLPLSINGGIIGLTAPGWRDLLPMPLIFTLILLIAFAIGISGWLMGQPERLRASVPRGNTGRDLAGAVFGSMTGIGIGMTFGLNQLFRGLGASELLSIQGAFAVVGGAGMVLAMWLRTRRIRSTCVVAVVHVLIASVLFDLVYRLAGTPAGLLAIACACAWWQATWFTAAFMVGASYSSTRSAVWATWLEGVVGFTAFMIFRIFG